jgi:hypothetical protein
VFRPISFAGIPLKSSRILNGNNHGDDDDDDDDDDNDKDIYILYFLYASKKII